MSDAEWEIPQKLQPDPDNYNFDLEAALRSVVGVRANVPQDAFTANALGTERSGSGVVFDARKGLVLTIGYLITEAETVWIIAADGRAIPGHALAFDQTTGFGVVQALGRLNLPALEFGDSDTLTVGATGILAASGGRAHAIETKVVGRQEFAGYWEYLLDEAIFTAPAHPFWSGAALIGTDGKLYGTGSLILQQGDGKRRHDMNMIVPVSILRPVLEDLLTLGQVNQPPRPWLGLFVTEHEGALVVGGLADNGPAEKAGIQAGDRVVGLGDEDISDLGALWRRLWSSGAAGTQIKMRLQRDDSEMVVRMHSADRAKFLLAPRLH